MCGIIGILSKDGANQNKVNFFKQALFADQLRGTHSTGMFLVNGQGKVDWAKRGINAADFLDLDPIKPLINRTDISRFAIGHNRHATAGGINNNNAHPFCFEHIIGVHNGTLRGNWRKHLNGDNKYSVDSEALFAAIEERGYEEVLPEIEGAYALVWYDDRNESLHMVRNDERPLAIGKVKDKETILIASEAAMLRWIAVRNGVELESIVMPNPGVVMIAHKDKPTEFSSVKLKEKPAVNFSQSRGKAAQGSNCTDLMQPMSRKKIRKLAKLDLKPGSVIELVLSSWTPYNPKTKNGLGYAIGTYMDDPYCNIVITHMLKKEFLEVSETENTLVGKVVDVTQQDHLVAAGDEVALVVEKSSVRERWTGNLYPGFGKAKLSLDEFKEKTKGGCSNCGTPLFPASANKLSWKSKDVVYCSACTKLEQAHAQGAAK